MLRTHLSMCGPQHTRYIPPLNLEFFPSQVPHHFQIFLGHSSLPNFPKALRLYPLHSQLPHTLSHTPNMEFLYWISTGCVMLLLPPLTFHLLQRFFFRLFDASQTIIIDEFDIQLFTSVHCYLTFKCPPSAQIFKISKPNNSDRLTFPINSTHSIQDTFDGMRMKWSLRTTEENYKIFGCVDRRRKIRSFELSFHNKYLTKVHSRYLPYVMEEAARIRRRNMNRRERNAVR